MNDLEATGKQQNNQNEHYNPKTAARIISPPCAVGPRGQSTQQGQYQNDNENSRHENSFLTVAYSYVESFRITFIGLGTFFPNDMLGEKDNISYQESELYLP